MSDKQMRTNMLVESAIRYARQNWPVIPDWWPTADGKCTCGDTDCKSPGKHPIGLLIPNGVQGASYDELKIRSWWLRCPEANVSIATGRVSNLVVLDIDARHGGLQTFEKLKKEYGDEPFQTLTVHTGGGGLHLYYGYPPGKFRSKQNFLPGIEIKSDSSKVTAPPSLHASANAYTWNDPDAEIKPLPPFIMELAKKGAERCYPVSRAPITTEELTSPLEKLTGDSDLKDVESVLRDITLLMPRADSIQRPIVLEAAKRSLTGMGIRGIKGFLDALTPRKTEPEKHPAITFEEPDPWPEPVNGADLLQEIEELYRKYVLLPDTGYCVQALWDLYTYVFSAFNTSPYLHFTSATKRSGKTTTMNLKAKIVYRALPASNITPAAVFRTIEDCSPTLLIDECDSFLNGNEDMRGILNSGHTRDMAYVIRLVGEGYEPRKFSTWCSKAFASIGKLPETITDRCITIPMKRKRPDEHKAKLRPTEIENELLAIRCKCIRWASDNFNSLSSADPAIPESLNDRQADNWTPFLAIADLVCGDWPEKTRAAALALSESIQEAEHPVSEMLLSDIRDLFNESTADRLFSESIVVKLGAMEERPWMEWKAGKPITARQLAKQLEPFGIAPKTIRIGSDVAKGYKLENFKDAFERYLAVTPFQSVTPLQTATRAAFSHFSDPLQTPDVTDRKNGQDEPPERIVTDVTDRKPQPQEEDTTFEGI